MIRDCELTPVGRTGKPHGISGELNLTLVADVDLASLRCVVIKIDKINVPFFLTSVRPKGTGSTLVAIDGINDEKAASELSEHDVYALTDELPDDGSGDEDGFYAGDLVGFHLTDGTGAAIGQITGVDDSTENILFEVERPDGPQVLIPVADEFITDIDIESRTIVMSLPSGLLDL